MPRVEYKKTCLNCGCVFAANVKHQRYCSEQCRYVYRQLHPRDNYEEPREKECPFCGKTFTAYFKHQKFCSNECCKLYKSGGNSHMQGKDGYVPERGMIPLRKCHDCGKPTYDYRCSECREKWRARYCVSGHEESYADKNFSTI